MVIRVIVLLSWQLFRLPLFCCRISRSKNIELLVLGQIVTILCRQVNRPQISPRNAWCSRCCNDYGRCGNEHRRR